MIAWLRRLWLILVVVIAAVLLWSNRQILDEALPALARLHWPTLGWVALAQVGFWVVTTASWKHLLAAVADRTVGFGAALLHLATVNAGKYLPGKVWGMVARGVLLGRHGIRARSALVATVHEQYLLVLAGAVVGVFCAMWLDPSRSGFFFVASVATAVLGWLAQRYGAAILVWVGQRFAPGQLDGGIDLMPLAPGRFATLVLLYGAAWLCNGAVVIGLYIALYGGPLAPDAIALIMVANTCGIIAGFFALFAPSGIGVREGVTAWLLTLYFPAAEAVLVTVAFRLWLTAIDVILIALVGGAELGRIGAAQDIETTREEGQ